MNFDEKMAEEYCNNEVPFDTTENGEKLYTENDMKYTYLTALRKGSQLDKVWRDYDTCEDSHDSKWVNRDSELEKKYDTCIREKASLRMHNAFIENSLSEAKNIIKDLIDYLGAADCERKQIRELKLFKEATRFLQEDDRDHFSQLCKIVRR